MTKAEMMNSLRALYECGNRSDSDSPFKETWTQPAMAGDAMCAPLDEIIRNLVLCGVLSADEGQAFYDNM